MNQAINRKQLDSPKLILQYMHAGIRVALKQNRRESESKDGMDVALCVIDKKKREILME